MCWSSVDKIFRRTKFSAPSQNFGTFVRRNVFIGFLFPPTIHKKNMFEHEIWLIWHVLDFSGQNFSVDKIFDSKSDFRQFSPPKFCPKRYVIYLKVQPECWYRRGASKWTLIYFSTKLRCTLCPKQKLRTKIPEKLSPSTIPTQQEVVVYRQLRRISHP